MISARMSRAARAVLVLTASIGVAAATTACGTQKISVSKSQPSLYHGATLFNQRCSGCHTLSSTLFSDKALGEYGTLTVTS